MSSSRLRAASPSIHARPRSTDRTPTGWCRQATSIQRLSSRGRDASTETSTQHQESPVEFVPTFATSNVFRDRCVDESELACFLTYCQILLSSCQKCNASDLRMFDTPVFWGRRLAQLGHHIAIAKETRTRQTDLECAKTSFCQAQFRQLASRVHLLGRGTPS